MRSVSAGNEVALVLNDGFPWRAGELSSRRVRIQGDRSERLARVPFCLHLSFGVYFPLPARRSVWSWIIWILTGGWFVRGSIIWEPIIFSGGSGVSDPLMGVEDGNYATNEAWSYDLIIRQWTLWASMLVPRALSACCVLDTKKKIIVASGFISCRKS